MRTVQSEKKTHQLSTEHRPTIAPINRPAILKLTHDFKTATSSTMLRNVSVPVVLSHAEFMNIA